MSKVRVDAIEISPLVGLNDIGQTVAKYEDAKEFEVCDEDDPHVIAWGVYIHREGIGATNLFDVPDKANALLAEKVLEEFYNL